MIKTGKSVGDTPVTESAAQRGLSRTKLQGPELQTCVVDVRLHKHFLMLVNGDSIIQRVSGWSTPVQTINHIRENSSGEVSLNGF